MRPLARSAAGVVVAQWPFHCVSRRRPQLTLKTLGPGGARFVIDAGTDAFRSVLNPPNRHFLMRYSGTVVLIVATSACASTASQPRLLEPTATYSLNASLPAEALSLGRPWSSTERSPEQCLQLLVGNHSVIPGKAFVMSFREEKDPSPEHVDDESFEMFSVQLDTIEFDTPIPLDSPTVHLYYSRGANAWVSRCAGEIGWVSTGQLTLRRSDGARVLAVIDAVVSTVDPRSGQPESAHAIRREMLLRPSFD